MKACWAQGLLLQHPPLGGTSSSVQCSSRRREQASNSGRHSRLLRRLLRQRQGARQRHPLLQTQPLGTLLPARLRRALELACCRKRWRCWRGCDLHRRDLRHHLLLHRLQQGWRNLD